MAERVAIGKPGDPCVEGDGRPSAEGFWCGACHMAAEREMEASAADRAEAGIPECDWFERQRLEAAVVEAAIAWREGLNAYTCEYECPHVDCRLARVVDALQAHREAR